MKGNVLVVSPEKCLHDERVLIQMKNLRPGSDVTLTSRVDCEVTKSIFFTWAHFRANEHGNIDLSKDGSMGGTYTGVFQMGPVANLKPAPGIFKSFRFINKNATIPMTVKINVLKGHLNEMEAYKPDENLILDSATHVRLYLKGNTQKIPVREGRVRGTLFIPEGEGPFPGVVDLFGASGNLMEFRAAQFASRGFAALALAYYDYEDIPVDIPELDIDYFDEAVKYLLKQEKVLKPNVAVIGLSKGADLAFSLATFIPEVKAAICVNGMSINGLKPMRLKDRTLPIPPSPSNPSVIKDMEIEPGVFSLGKLAPDPASYPECQIPIEKADAQFLLIASLDDMALNPAKEYARVAEILKKHGKNNYEVLKYEGGGHLLESPFAPHAWYSFHPVFKYTVVWGGNAKQHTDAAEDAWQKVMEFIRKHIH